MQVEAEEPTPLESLVDRSGRPYFLWDVDMTLDEFRRGLADRDPEVRAYLAGKLLRQARSADVGMFLTNDELRELWPLLSRYLGQTRDAWRARLGIAEALDRAGR